jgi:hypothetical protein
MKLLEDDKDRVEQEKEFVRDNKPGRLDVSNLSWPKWVSSRRMCSTVEASPSVVGSGIEKGREELARRTGGRPCLRNPVAQLMKLLEDDKAPI